MDVTKYPRIYCDQDFKADAVLDLSSAQLHYFRSVMRRQDGDLIRVFNGRNGEWIGALFGLGKKSGQVVLERLICEQLETGAPIRLYFAPIKKARMDLLVEKAVEMGVTDLYPVMTANVQNSKLNDERMRLQIVEAAEQCERMDVPRLHAVQKLRDFQPDGDIYWCAERFDGAMPLGDFPEARDFLIGPEGGFTEDEKARLQGLSNVQPVSLGDRLLRAETAVMMCLSFVCVQNL